MADPHLVLCSRLHIHAIVADAKDGDQLQRRQAGDQLSRHGGFAVGDEHGKGAGQRAKVGVSECGQLHEVIASRQFRSQGIRERSLF